MSNNLNLHNARKNKNDEFYTMYKDIEKECEHYVSYFENQVIYLNCDNPKYSNFWAYFHKNFAKFKLKMLMSTYYSFEGKSSLGVYGGGNDDAIQYYESIPLNDNGDFRSEECTLILQECDIVITNPPFSLAIEFINYLIDSKKKFLILCNINAIKQKNVFPHFINNLFWLGYDRSMNYHFKIPNTYTLFDEKFTDAMNDGCHYGKVDCIAWFTNLPVDIISTINLTSKYYGNEDNYPKYDNYDIINVDKSKDIPCDYYDIMGVPITFLLKWNPQQFDLLGTERWCKDNCVKALYRGKKVTCDEDKAIILNGKELYTRVFIRRKENTK